MEKYRVVRNEGQALTAICSASGNPVPSVTWEGQAQGNAELVFTDIDRKSRGDYNCTGKAFSGNYADYDFSNAKILHIEVNCKFSDVFDLLWSKTSFWLYFHLMMVCS